MSENKEMKKATDLDDLLSDPFGAEILEKPVLKEVQTSPEKPRRLLDVLPEENREKAIQLAKQIDPTDQQAMILYM